MTGTNIADFIAENGFQHVGEVRDDGTRLRILVESPQAWQTNGWVYMWVIECSEGRKVLYVGKADGAVLRERMRQHEHGFSSSSRGRTHAGKLREVLADAQARVRVFARKSSDTELWGARVSLCDAEEKALIARLSPPWNWQPREKRAA